MALIWDMLRTLTVLVVLTTLTDLILPPGTMQRYARLVSGLLLLLALLTPWMKLLGMVFPGMGGGT